jgi:hypothetical protein
MHWRGEGVLRNGVKVLGEVVPVDSIMTSDDTKIEEIPVTTERGRQY